MIYNIDGKSYLYSMNDSGEVIFNTYFICNVQVSAMRQLPYEWHLNSLTRPGFNFVK